MYPALESEERAKPDRSLAITNRQLDYSPYGDEAGVLGDVKHLVVYNRSFESGVLATLRGCFPEYDAALWDFPET